MGKKLNKTFMKLFCGQKDLDYAINIVNKAISPNNTLPVLNNILIKAEGKRLFFASTNLEIAITCSIEADVRSEGAITVPAKLLTAYVALLNNEKVEISLVDGMNLSLKCASSNTKIKCISADEFPLIPKVEEGEKFSIATNVLHDAITETVFSASMNTARPVLSGLSVSAVEGGVKFVATDSYRLAEKVVKLDKALASDLSCIIPARTMMELSKILARAEEKVTEVVISKNQVLFKVSGVELISRLIEGKFPDYEKIVPTEKKSVFEVSVDSFALVLKRVSLFARENNNSVKLAVETDGKMVVSSDETKIGEEKAEVLIKLVGEQNQVSLNAQYLLDVLTYSGDEKVEVVLNDKTAPALIRPLKEGGCMYIIMPLKI